MMFWERAALYESLESVCIGVKADILQSFSSSLLFGEVVANSADAGADAKCVMEFPGLAAASCQGRKAHWVNSVGVSGVRWRLRLIRSSGIWKIVLETKSGRSKRVRDKDTFCSVRQSHSCWRPHAAQYFLYIIGMDALDALDALDPAVSSVASQKS